MNRNLGTIFNTTAVSPRDGLEHDIIRAVHVRMLRRARIRFWASLSVTVGALAGLVPAIMHLGNQVTTSGFADYAGLLFSGDGAIWNSVRELGYLLAESLPVMSVVLVATILLVMIYGMKKMFENRPAEILFANA